MPMPTLAPGHVGPFAGLDVPWLLKLRAQTRSDHPFIVWAPFERPPVALTYAAFHDRVGALAAGLARRGVKPGEFVLIHLDNCLEALLAWYACVELGAVAVTTNTRSAGPEVAYFAEHCGAVAAITQPAHADIVAANCPALRWLAVTDNDGGEPAQGPRLPEKADRFDALFADAADRPHRSHDPLWPCSVQYTSGTTARPKAVLWTHANALWGAKINAAHEDLRPDDIHLVHLPLFHTNALAYSVLATLWVGGTAVVQPRFSASRFWSTAAEHRCTWTSVVPFCVRALMERDIPKRHTFRLWGNAVSSPPADAAIGIRTIGWWGMTETITHGIVGELHQPNTSMAIGRAASEYDIRVVDADGSPTPPGGTGHLLIKGIPGLSLFKEYLFNDKAMRESFDEHGYFITGDRVMLLDNGFIRFADRDKDMLKVGGENVAASEIEQAIVQVAGVREVAVVARKHPMLDEVPVAFVIPQGGLDGAPPGFADTVLAACRSALADFKVPREIHLVDDMPRSTLEKIAKAELRKRLQDA